MGDHGITRKICMWYNTLNVKNWNYRVKSYLASINKLLYVDLENIIDKECFLTDVTESTEMSNEQQWLQQIKRENSKYKKGKINCVHIIHHFTSELYVHVYMVMPTAHSAYGKFLVELLL